MIPVIDISQAQGVVNMGKMRSTGVRGLFMRIAHGLTLDTRVDIYYPDALAAGFGANEIGFYSFINPKRGSGADTGAFAAQQCQEAVGHDPKIYMIDVENYSNQSPNLGQHPVTGAAFAEYLDEHLAAFRAESPSTVIIGYTNRSYWNNTLGPNDIALALALDWIVPRYPVNSTLGYAAHPLPGVDGWETWAFGLAPGGPFPPIGATWSGWQFSAGYNAQGSRYGCTSANLDLNIISPAAWARWTTITPSPEPQPPGVDDMLIRLLAPTDSSARFLATCTAGAAALRCEWTGHGDSGGPVDQRIAFFRGAFTPPVNDPAQTFEMALTVAGLINVSLDGALPPGFTADQFANRDEIVARTMANVDTQARADIKGLQQTVNSIDTELDQLKVDLRHAGGG